MEMMYSLPSFLHLFLRETKSAVICAVSVSWLREKGQGIDSTSVAKVDGEVGSLTLTMCVTLPMMIDDWWID